MDDQLFSRYEDLVLRNAAILVSAKFMKEQLRQFKAVLMTKFLEEGTSVAKAEILALASSDYQEKLRKAIDTVRDAEVTKSQLDSIKMKADWQRTKEATKRAEMQLQ